MRDHTFWVQMFDRARGGTRVTGRRFEAQNGELAIAAAKARLEPTVGAAALRIVLEHRTRAIVSAEVLATFGDVPAGFLQELITGEVNRPRRLSKRWQTKV